MLQQAHLHVCFVLPTSLVSSEIIKLTLSFCVISDMTGNQITQWPALSPASTIYVNTLKLGINSLTSLPADFYNLGSLTFLNVTGNKLSSLPGFSNSGTGTTTVYVPFINCSFFVADYSLQFHLNQKRDLSSNRYTTLPSLSGFTALKTLFVFLPISFL